MTDGSLIQMRSAGFRVARKGRGQGLIVLYQDKLARVSYQAEVVGVALGAALAGTRPPSRKRRPPPGGYWTGRTSNAGCLAAMARIWSSVESGPVPSKKMPTSAFHRLR